MTGGFFALSRETPLAIKRHKNLESSRLGAKENVLSLTFFFFLPRLFLSSMVSRYLRTLLTSRRLSGLSVVALLLRRLPEAQVGPLRRCLLTSKVAEVALWRLLGVHSFLGSPSSPMSFRDIIRRPSRLLAPSRVFFTTCSLLAISVFRKP